MLIGSILDLIVLWASGRWLLPHVQRFLEAHGRTEPNYLGITIPRGMGILIWLLIGLQEMLLQSLLLFEPIWHDFMLWSGLYEDQINRGIELLEIIEAAFRMYAFAVTVIFLLGWTDDLIGNKSVKGLRGHWRYCRDSGAISMGAVKAVGTFTVSVWLIMTQQHGKIPIWEMGIDLLLLTLSTNALNLLDVRPGRSLKVFLFATLAIGLGCSVWEVTQLLCPIVPAIIGGLLLYRNDVKARGMLGDAGANLLGFTLGYGMTMVLPLEVKICLILVLSYLHKQAETSSLTKIIEQNRFLNWLDRLGRT